MLTSTASSLVSGGARLGAATASAALGGTAKEGLSAAPKRGNYFIDLLFRSDHPNPSVNASSQRAEVTRIVASSLAHGELVQTDEIYLAQLVAAHTAQRAVDAEQRVITTIAQAKADAAEVETAAREAADKARKAAAKVSLWTFFSLWVGAFCASYAATVGGRQRDSVKL